MLCGNIGLGSVKTGHGTPDMRVRGGEVAFVMRTVEESGIAMLDCDDGEASDSNTTTFEGKIHFNEANLPQLVATCIIAPFTEHTCHPRKPTIIPTLLIDEKCFRVCFYDCATDILMLKI